MTLTEGRSIPNEPDDYEPTPFRHAIPHNGTRPMPHDNNTEASLVGALFVDGGAIIDNTNTVGLTAKDFYTANHQTIWAAAAHIHAAGNIIDVRTIAHQLGGDLERVGGDSALVELMATTGTYKSTAAAHARIICRHAALRRLIRVAGDIAEIGYTPTDDPATALARVRDLVEHVATSVLVEHDPWKPQSISDAWDRPVLEQPVVLAREDGANLFYAGRINTVVGPPESGKSWVAYLACAQLANQQQHCAYIDLEDRVGGAAARLRNLGVGRADADQYIHYFNPDTDLTGAVAAMQHLNVDLDLIVIDSASEAVVAGGGEINSNDDNTRFGRALRRLAAVTGAAILFVDHVSQAHESGSGKSLGAGAKRRFIDGAAYETVIIHRFGPGREGEARVLNTKDRHGGVVACCLRKGKHDIAGQLVIHSDPSGNIHRALIVDPSDLPADTTSTGDFRPTGYMERVSRWLELHPGDHTRNDIQAGVKGTKEHIDTALQRLAIEGHTTRVAGPRNSSIYTHLKPYREAEDTYNPTGPGPGRD